MHLTHLSFPQIRLQRRDGHKLRGYFAQQFGQESDLFHNHDNGGKSIYRYPQIQYKVVQGTPTLVGLNEGANLLVERFLRIKAIEVDGLWIPLEQKNMKSDAFLVGVRGALHQYEFLNPWMALNQQNYQLYLAMTESEKKEKLQRILINNIIAFFKAIGYHEQKEMLVNSQIKEARLVGFKDKKLMAFTGGFISNVQLPNYIGLGKSVSRGFGTIREVQ